MLDAIDGSGATTSADDGTTGTTGSQTFADAVRAARDEQAREHHAAGITNAAQTIAQVTAPNGQVDTKSLGGAIAAAAKNEMGRASVAYRDIHAQLSRQDPQLATTFNSDFRTALRAGDDTAKGAARGMSTAGRDLLVNNPILTKQWESTKSEWTGKGGFTANLTKMLEDHGIQVRNPVNPSPANSIGGSSGDSAAMANNKNGALARDAIADRLRAQGFEVQTEVPRNNGRRVVDVVADHKLADPRMNQRIEIESKVGRTGQSPVRAGQIAEDASQLAENAKLRGAGSALESAGRVLRPVAVVADAVQIGQAFHEDGDRIGTHTGRTLSGVAGGWGGAIAGAEGGAIGGAPVGSVVPVVGTAAGGVIGGVVGGIAGGIGGDWFGRRAFDTVKSWF